MFLYVCECVCVCVCGCVRVSVCVCDPPLSPPQVAQRRAQEEVAARAAKAVKQQKLNKTVGAVASKNQDNKMPPINSVLKKSAWGVCVRAACVWVCVSACRACSCACVCERAYVTGRVCVSV
ncbi:MAG: hypothetical protein P4L40_02555 [Terracidiphilus sp.]|nr:hypothetical protein [Terracidiphilus sp.]